MDVGFCCPFVVALTLHILFSFSMKNVMDPPPFPIASPFVMLPYFELGLVLPFLYFKVLLLLGDYFETLICDYS